MNMPSQPPEHPLRRLVRTRGWLIPVALFAFVPKCGLCLLAYAGLGAALGLGGPELCGASGGAAGQWSLGLAGLGVMGGIAAFLLRPTGPAPDARPYKTTGRSAIQPRSE